MCSIVLSGIVYSLNTLASQGSLTKARIIILPLLIDAMRIPSDWYAQYVGIIIIYVL